MGIIRGGLLSIVCFLILVSFLAGGLFLILYLSLNYNVLEKEFVSINKEILGDRINQQIPLIQEACQNNTGYIFNETGFDKTIFFPCDKVSFNSDSIIEYGVKDFLRQVYYDEYPCGFWKCLAQGGQGSPFVLISQKAQDYWKSKFYFVLIASLILIVLGFLLVENKFNFLIIIGGILTVSAFLLKKLMSFLSFLLPDSIEEFFFVIISQSSRIVRGFLIIGIVLLVLGVIIRLIGSGFVKRHFSKKEVEEIVKEEVEKVKKDEIKDKLGEKSKEKKSKGSKK